jgi:hypothetical protein
MLPLYQEHNCFPIFAIGVLYIWAKPASQSPYTMFPCDNLVKAILGQAWAVTEVAFIWNFILYNEATMSFSILHLIANPDVRPQIKPLISNRAGKKCPIVCIPARADSTGIR